MINSGPLSECLRESVLQWTITICTIIMNRGKDVMNDGRVMMRTRKIWRNCVYLSTNHLDSSCSEHKIMRAKRQRHSLDKLTEESSSDLSAFHCQMTIRRSVFIFSSVDSESAQSVERGLPLMSTWEQQQQPQSMGKMKIFWWKGDKSKVSQVPHL